MRRDKQVPHFVFYILTILAVTASLSGCAGSAAWKNVNPGHHTYAGKLGFTADLPQGWLMYEEKTAPALLLTRRSVPMDFIQLKRYPLFTPLPFTGLTVNAGMQPYEIAEVIENNLRATPGVYSLVTEYLSPAVINGIDGFELMMSYAMENGIRRRCLIYGFIVEEKYYAEAALYALEDFYFSEALKDFVEMVGSIRVK